MATNHKWVPSFIDVFRVSISKRKNSLLTDDEILEKKTI